MISIDEAGNYVASQIRVTDADLIPLRDCLGTTATAPVIATEPVPGFANSSMDGYALRSRDTLEGRVELRVVDRIMAGSVANSPLGSGEAMRIMTGAPVPLGADCVEMLEAVQVSDSGDSVWILRSLSVGAHIRQPGEDIRVGDQLIAPGDLLNPVRIGVLASQGLTSVLARRRPRVGVLSTGNELTGLSGTLAPGAIRDVNRPLLLALLTEASVEPIDLGVVPDDYETVRGAIADGTDSCDAVITTGGVSVGDADFVKVALAELAPQNARSMQIAMRPGKPFAFAVVGERRVPVFGLPGNPVSTRVSYELFVRPSLRFMAGRALEMRTRMEATLDCDLERQPDGKTHLVHVSCELSTDGRLHITGAMREGSHLLHAIASANAIAEVPDGQGLERGATVRVIVLDPETLTQHRGSA